MTVSYVVIIIVVGGPFARVLTVVRVFVGGVSMGVDVTVTVVSGVWMAKGSMGSSVMMRFPVATKLSVSVMV